MIICLVSFNSHKDEAWYQRTEILINAKSERECAMILFKERYIKIKTLIEFEYLKEAVLKDENEYTLDGFTFYFNKKGLLVMKSLLILYHHYLYYKYSKLDNVTPAIQDFLKIKQPRVFFPETKRVLTYGENLINFYCSMKKDKPGFRPVLVIPKNSRDFLKLRGFYVNYTLSSEDISKTISEDIDRGVWEINFNLHHEISYFAEIHLNDKIVIL